MQKRKQIWRHIAEFNVKADMNIFKDKINKTQYSQRPLFSIKIYLMINLSSYSVKKSMPSSLEV